MSEGGVLGPKMSRDAKKFLGDFDGKKEDTKEAEEDDDW